MRETPWRGRSTSRVAYPVPAAVSLPGFGDGVALQHPRTQKRKKQKNFLNVFSNCTQTKAGEIRRCASLPGYFGALWRLLPPLVICPDPGSNQPPPAPPLSLSRLNPAGSEPNTVGSRRSLTGAVQAFRRRLPRGQSTHLALIKWHLLIVVSLFLSKLFPLVPLAQTF